MLLEIALEVVNQPNRLVEQLRRVAAIHQDGFRAEHFRHFGQNRRAAHAAQQVGEAADDWVRRDAGEAVRTAALQPNHKFAGRAGDTLLIPHVVRKLTQQLHRFGKLIFHLLADEEAHARLVVVAHMFLDDGGAGIFAAQPQHQHAADVGVRRQIRQNRARILLIIAHLRAAVGVREGTDTLHAAADKLLRRTFQLAGNVVDAADGGQNPQLIAHADAPVFARIAHERRCRNFWNRRVRRVIFIRQLAGQAGVQIVDMHMRADGNILLRVANREAILDDLFARLDGEKRHLMPGGNVRDRGERNAIHRHGLPGGQGGQGDCHIVLRGDAK